LVSEDIHSNKRDQEAAGSRDDEAGNCRQTAFPADGPYKSADSFPVRGSASTAWVLIDERSIVDAGLSWAGFAASMRQNPPNWEVMEGSAVAARVLAPVSAYARQDEGQPVRPDSTRSVTTFPPTPAPEIGDIVTRLSVDDSVDGIPLRGGKDLGTILGCIGTLRGLLVGAYQAE
jgi:hypothetical protein